MDAAARHTFVARNIDPQADNAIHDDEVAQRFGFTGALVPGVELFAGVTSELVATWGRQWLSGGEVALRFRRPVYDGERLLVELTGQELAVRGPDGQVRCVGSAGPTAQPRDLRRLVQAPQPSPLPRDPSIGALGTVVERVERSDNEAYVDATGEPLSFYREDAVAHPGLLLRLVNLQLMRNVALGPWIHTSSSCVLMGSPRLPATMTVQGEATELWTRNGHDYVRYDAMVFADGKPVLQVDHTAIYRLAG